MEIQPRRVHVQNNSQLAKLAQKIDESKRLPHSQRHSPLSFTHATSPISNRQVIADQMNSLLSLSVSNMNSIQTIHHNLPINLKGQRLGVVHKKSKTSCYNGPAVVVPTPNILKQQNRNQYHKRNHKDVMQNDDFKNNMSKYHKKSSNVNKSQIVQSYRVIDGESFKKNINEKKHIKPIRLQRKDKTSVRTSVNTSQENSLGRHTARFNETKEQDSIDNPASFMAGKLISIESRENSLNRILAQGSEGKCKDSQATVQMNTLRQDSLNGPNLINDTLDSTGDFMSCISNAITYFMNNNEVKYQRKGNSNKIIEENNIMKEQLIKTRQYQNNAIKALKEKDQIIKEQEMYQYQLQQQIEDMEVSLKECEIRLAHTTELYTREKIEKESTAIAFKRIINKMTMEPQRVRQQPTMVSSRFDQQDDYYTQRLEEQLNDKDEELRYLKQRGILHSTESIDNSTLEYIKKNRCATQISTERYNQESPVSNITIELF